MTSPVTELIERQDPEAVAANAQRAYDAAALAGNDRARTRAMAILIAARAEIARRRKLQAQAGGGDAA